MKKTVKKIFKVLGIVLGVILLVLIAYIIYLYANYHRIEDNLVLEVESAPDAGTGFARERKESLVAVRSGP